MCPATYQPEPIEVSKVAAQVQQLLQTLLPACDEQLALRDLANKIGQALYPANHCIATKTAKHVHGRLVSLLQSTELNAVEYTLVRALQELAICMVSSNSEKHLSHCKKLVNLLFTEYPSLLIPEEDLEPLSYRASHGTFASTISVTLLGCPVLVHYASEPPDSFKQKRCTICQQSRGLAETITRIDEIIISQLMRSVRLSSPTGQQMVAEVMSTYSGQPICESCRQEIAP